ncbi:MAG: LOW QUALITY PROTEIN: hypothetical protein J3Q66DRAFT_370966 [Benniella sp.]|nr:MAG: LOW QUALITY PROTEIN: hypothetical protein J3Q66DRAFT_370966 [Benniella sp.]
MAIRHPEQPAYSQGESEPGDTGDQQQHSRRKRSRNQQVERNVMDMLDEDDTDDELVERLFHEGRSAAGAESLAKAGPMQSYLDLCHRMEEIGFGSRMTDVVTRVLYDRVEAKIFNSFKRRWDTATLDRERIKEFFDIVVECPDSEPAVLDLQECIEWTGQRDQLQNAFLAAVDKRLMHPGAETTDIVEFYISTIKYLRVLDSSGVMLDCASRAIEIPEVLMQMEMGDEGTDDEVWVPEPKNAGPDPSSARIRMADTISALRQHLVDIASTPTKLMHFFVCAFVSLKALHVPLSCPLYNVQGDQSASGVVMDSFSCEQAVEACFNDFSIVRQTNSSSTLQAADGFKHQ